MAVRALLGAAEAAAIPGFSLLTGMFYKRQEHPLRFGFWFLGNSVGIALAGLISFGIAHIKSGIGAWKVRVACSKLSDPGFPDNPIVVVRDSGHHHRPVGGVTVLAAS